MKKFNLLSILCAGIFTMLVTSCHNDPVSFPDFAYSTVFFAYQTPVRTIVLGDDTYDTSLDNAHKCEIYATMGGVYANKKTINIDFVVDNTLCNDLNFSDATPVTAMPASYYSLAGSKISLDHALQGAVGVQLNDAFFADPKALVNTYVIPLRMTNVVNADSILSGTKKVANAARLNPALWDIAPKDYVLYCIKFINPWHGNYLRRGKDVATGSGLDTTLTYHQKYVEYDQVVSMTSLSLNAVKVSLTTRNKGSLTNLPYDLQLNVDNAGKITVANGGSTSPTYTVSGTGEYVTDGDMWGGIKRDVMRLSYQVNFTGVKPTTHSFKDTIVIRDRGMKSETFVPFKYQ